LGFVGKEGGAKACLSSTRKGHSPSLDNALWATPFVSCPAPGLRIRTSLFDFQELAFEKENPKSYAKGFGLDFSAVLKFTGQQ